MCAPYIISLRYREGAFEMGIPNPQCANLAHVNQTHDQDQPHPSLGIHLVKRSHDGEKS